VAEVVEHNWFLQQHLYPSIPTPFPLVLEALAIYKTALLEVSLQSHIGVFHHQPLVLRVWAVVLVDQQRLRVVTVHLVVVPEETMLFLELVQLAKAIMVALVLLVEHQTFMALVAEVVLVQLEEMEQLRLVAMAVMEL
jgi:hypothetical protein